MLELYRLDERIVFPSVEHAHTEPNGLLAYGGDLSVKRLRSAYLQGIFPWYSEGEPLLWWSPSPRGVLLLDDFYCSKSLKKSIRKQSFDITLNHAFEEVISACADIPRNFGSHPQTDTWITQEMQDAYIDMHTAGLASSVEVWKEGTLVGGLYGITIGAVFCGESMFHAHTDASKVALAALVEHMKKHDMGFIDCQMSTEHLARLGCKDMPRQTFLTHLSKYKNETAAPTVWAPQRLKLTI